MKLKVVKIHNLQPKQYHSYSIGGELELDLNQNEDHELMIQVAAANGLTAANKLELASKVARVLLNEHFDAQRKEYDELPASFFNTAKA